jgi:hypothetical protein
MIARSAPSFTIRNILDRVGFSAIQQLRYRGRGIRPNLWQRIFAAIGAWSSVSALAWRSEILLHEQPERFRHFCRDCRENTMHEGFDELGAGWYAQISRCERCGRQGMRVWPLAW